MKNVLVIVNNVLLSREITNSLRMSNFHPIASNNYQEAMRLVESQYPDIIITDLDIWQEESYAILKQIHQFTLVSHLPIIILNDKLNNEFLLDLDKLNSVLFMERRLDTNTLVNMIVQEVKQKI